jgi:hypothetical protein
MQKSNYPLPEYVHYGQKTAAEMSLDYSNDINITSKENVWLSALKLASMELPDTIQTAQWNKVVEAANHYRIVPDIQKAAEFTDKLNETPKGVYTENDWRLAQDWLRKNAEYLPKESRAVISDYLFEKSAELGCVPTVDEKVEFAVWSGRDPVIDEIEKIAEADIHRLATGNYYRTNQFAAIPFEEISEVLPAVTKKAAFETHIINGSLLADAAKTVDENSATVIEALLNKHGQYPVYAEGNLPLEINDAILSKL